MKTTRTSVFESNSSSTHSVTIRSKTPKKALEGLVVDGILIPKNLSTYTHSFGYDSSATVCDTKDKKAAIVYHWLLSMVADEELTEALFSEAIQILVELCGYTSIEPLGKRWGDFSPCSDCDSNADDDYRDDLIGGDLESFRKFVNQVILDDDQEISDCDTEN